MRILLFLSLLLSSVSSPSFYIKELMGDSQPAYIQEYFKRMWSWYNANYPDLKNYLNDDEERFIDHISAQWQSWGISIDEGFHIENFRFSHRVNKKNVDHGIFYLGQPKWTSLDIKGLQKVLMKRRIQYTTKKLKDSFLGIQWDASADEQTLYFKKGQKVEFIVYKKGKNIDQGHMERVEDYKKPFVELPTGDVLSVVKMISPRSGERLHFRYKAFFVPALTTAAFYISKKHLVEFNQNLDSLEIINKQKYTLHYP